MSMWNRPRPGASPVRREEHVLVQRDKQGVTAAVPTSVEESSVSPEGSLDTRQITVLQVYGCLHSIEEKFGGECHDCKKQSCERCHGQCATCSRPICLGCSRTFKEDPAAREARVCIPCNARLRRRRVGQFFGRLLIGPFVQATKPNSGA